MRAGEDPGAVSNLGFQWDTDPGRREGSRKDSGSIRKPGHKPSRTELPEGGGKVQKAWHRSQSLHRACAWVEASGTTCPIPAPALVEHPNPQAGSRGPGSGSPVERRSSEPLDRRPASEACEGLRLVQRHGISAGYGEGPRLGSAVRGFRPVSPTHQPYK